MALIRAREAAKPEGERVCYDPYAIRFVSRETLDIATRYPEQFKAYVARVENSVPGSANSIVARVRFIDDTVKTAAGEGLEQLVILGAGYDSRAYRIEELKKVRVFEVDHPGTQRVKTEKVREIFGSLPDHVTYVPADIGAEDPGQKLLESGYDRSRKTLFVAEGLLMYLPPEAVDRLLSFIAHNSGKGSSVVFDYHARAVSDGSCELEAAQNLRKFAADSGEPFRFDIRGGDVEAFLAQRGFRNFRNLTGEAYQKLYFGGKNERREVNSLLAFACAEVN